METLFVIYIATVITLLTVLYLCFSPAPYGKFTPASGVFSSFKINSKLAWMLQECPAFFIPFHVIVLRWSTLSPMSILGLGLFSLHYFNRSFIFPLLIKSGRSTPIETCLSAFGFCCFNGWLQCKSTVESNLQVRDAHASILGLILFFVGMYINISSDSHLRELAAQRVGNVYLTPHKGMFQYVSAANYFGEIVEWLGFALLLQTPAAAWFSLFTTLFLGQRGYQTHKYYLSKIDDYPKSRSSVFPFSGF